MTAPSRPIPPPGYSVRAPRPEDAEAVAALKRAAYSGRREGGAVTAGSVLQDWSLPKMELDRDVWLVDASGGALAADAFLFEDAPATYVRVHRIHPDHEGRGLEEYLLDVAEARVRERLVASPASDAKLALVAYESEPHTRDLYAAREYAQVRTFVRLRVSLESAPQPAVVPPGIIVRRFRKDRDERAFYEALQEAFLDHWEPTVMSFEEWLRSDYDDPDADLTLWWVAWDDAQVAGVLRASAAGADGSVDDLGVRRPWRSRGLARALLLTALAEFRRRSLRTAYLGVDTLNPTGAMHLYTSVGMAQTGEAHSVFEKVLTAR